MPEAAIRSVALTKRYDMGPITTTAVSDISVELFCGRMTAITGPSGSGKSTLLALFALLEAPSSGRLWLMGEDVSAATDRGRAAVRNKHLGVILQEPLLDETRSVLWNAALPLLIRGVQKAERLARAAEALERYGLGRRLRHMPWQLSGGQRQRVAIARALVAEPRILLADEPTGSLDEKNGHDVIQILSSLSAEDRCVVLVTHNLSHARQADCHVELVDGHLRSISNI